MTTFQIITIIISGLALLGTIVGVYIRLKIDITKLQVEITNMKKDSSRADKIFETFKRENNESHQHMYKKLDELKDIIINNQK